ncbi:MAG: 50S ribosomal protein L11 methyltransferase [Deltaproteobacteria bacterium]|nr:50S ribosomal protein L11 methyltransferase [Deltaproteobacteria bacterium]
MPTRWIEIKATGRSGAKDEAASILIKAGSPGVVEEVKGPLVNTLVSHSAWGTDVFPEDADDTVSATLIAYIRPLPQIGSIGGSIRGLKDIEKDLDAIGWSFTSSAYRDRDWSQAWKAGIKPVSVGFRGGRVVVRPPWRKIDKRPGDIVINIDPGMAFGTGGHQTTKMCIRAIASLLTSPEFPPGSSSLLDVGAGSGVLAIAAKKLRTKKVMGIDIDPEALKAARKNARLNRAETLRP